MLNSDFHILTSALVLFAWCPLISLYILFTYYCIFIFYIYHCCIHILTSALVLFAWCRPLLSIAFLRFLPKVLPSPSLLSVTLVCTAAPSQYIASTQVTINPSLSSPISFFCPLQSVLCSRASYVQTPFSQNRPMTVIFCTTIQNIFPSACPVFCTVDCIIHNSIFV